MEYIPSDHDDTNILVMVAFRKQVAQLPGIHVVQQVVQKKEIRVAFYVVKVDRYPLV